MSRRTKCSLSFTCISELTVASLNHNFAHGSYSYIKRTRKPVACDILSLCSDLLRYLEINLSYSYAFYVSCNAVAKSLSFCEDDFLPGILCICFFSRFRFPINVQTLTLSFVRHVFN